MLEAFTKDSSTQEFQNQCVPALGAMNVEDQLASSIATL